MVLEGGRAAIYRQTVDDWVGFFFFFEGRRAAIDRQTIRTESRLLKGAAIDRQIGNE